MSGWIALEGDGRLVTVQDFGRQGAMRFGVSASGPMDWVRFGHALALAGGSGAAAFEIGIAGATFAVTGRVTLAVTGPGFTVRQSGREEAVTTPARLVLENGERLTVQPGQAGMWAYVAVRGIDFGAPLLSSYATNARTGLGARDLGAGFAVQSPAQDEPLAASDIALADGPIGLLPGPQVHLFDDSVRARMAETPYRLSAQVDRMGYRLEGEPLRAATHDIISDGIVEGAIQVPGNGQPIVLCADRAPTGGYPKIAVVASADLPRLTQSRPGDTLRFAWIAIVEANRRRRAIKQALAGPVVPRLRTEFTSQFLAERNLIGGVTAGTDYGGCEP